MRIALAFSILLLVSGLAPAADNAAGSTNANAGVTALTGEDKRAVMARFNAFNAAYQADNYEAVMDLTYPTLVDMMGGRETFIRNLKRLDENAGDAAVKIESQTSTEPQQLIDAGDSSVCVIPTVVIMTVKGTRARETSFTLAVRKKGGTGWTLIGGSGLRAHPEMLAQLLPGLPRSVQLPPNKIEKVDAAGMPVKARKQSAEEIAKAVGKTISFPARVDDVTTLTGVTGSGNALTYNYMVNDESLPPESIDAILEQIRGAARNQICKSPNTAAMLDDGYTLIYNYALRKSGKQVRVEVKPGGCAS